eukprot:748485-Hanusia_phi.AAC.5
MAGFVTKDSMSRLPPIEIILHVSDTLALGQILKLRCGQCNPAKLHMFILLSRCSTCFCSNTDWSDVAFQFANDGTEKPAPCCLDSSAAINQGIELSYIYDFDMAKRLLAKVARPANTSVTGALTSVLQFCNLECLRLYKCDEASTLILQVTWQVETMRRNGHQASFQDVETFAFHTSLTALCCDCELILACCSTRDGLARKAAEATSFKHVMETCKQLKALGSEETRKLCV